MPRSALIVHLSVALVVSCSSISLAQRGNPALMPDSTLRQYGLTRAWHTHVELDPASDEVQSITQHTRFDEKYTIFEVRAPQGVRHVITERDRDKFGRVLEIEGAKAFAESKAEMLKSAMLDEAARLEKSKLTRQAAQLRADAAKIKVTQRTIPQITLFAQTRRGVIHAIDAETGATLWARNVGRRDYPTTAAAANDKHVAVINGSLLFVLDRKDGKINWQRTVGGAPGAGPGLSRQNVFVPMSNGRIEGYSLENHRQPPWIHRSIGRSFIQPLVTPRSVSWPTDRGHLYVGRPDFPGIRFRLETRGDILTRPAYRYPLLFAASRDGSVYAVHEAGGDTKWRFSAGVPINEQPAAVGEALYVFPEQGGMYRLNSEDGKQVWWAPRATRFVAASESKIYAQDIAGRILIFDAATGGYIDRIPTEHLSLKIVNQDNDRIYVGLPSGSIECWHEIDLPKPVIHIGEVAPEEEGTTAGKIPATGKTPGKKQPADKTPDDKMPDDKTPDDKTPADDAPDDEMPAKKQPGKKPVQPPPKPDSPNP